MQLPLMVTVHIYNITVHIYNIIYALLSLLQTIGIACHNNLLDFWKPVHGKLGREWDWIYSHGLPLASPI